MKKLVSLLCAIAMIFTMTIVSFALGGTCNAQVTTYLITGKKASASCTNTGNAAYKFVSYELYLSGDGSHQPSYWEDHGVATKDSVSVSGSKINAVNGFAIAALYSGSTSNTPLVDGVYTPQANRHG